MKHEKAEKKVTKQKRLKSNVSTAQIAGSTRSELGHED